MGAWVGGWGAASLLVVGLLLLWVLHCGAFELAKSCWCRVPWFLSFSSWSEDRCQRRVEAKVSVRTVTQLRGRTGRPSPLCLRRPVLPQIGKTRQDQARPSRAAHLGTAPLCDHHHQWYPHQHRHQHQHHITLFASNRQGVPLTLYRYYCISMITSPLLSKTPLIPASTPPSSGLWQKS